MHTETMGRVARTAMIAGSAGAVGMTLYAGRHNHSCLLMALFVIWVLVPFVVLWRLKLAVPPLVLDYVSIFLTIASLSIYAYVAFGPPRAKTAPAFLMVPLASLFITLVVTMICRRRATH